MTRNEQQSAITHSHGANEVRTSAFAPAVRGLKTDAVQLRRSGVLLTRPRGYRAFKTVFMLGRTRTLNAGLVTLSGAFPGAHALDIGSGPGDLARALVVRVGASGRVIGVDPSPKMVAYAAERARGLPNCRFELGAAQSLTLADASVDIVTCTFVMHHIPEAQRGTALAHMFRVLRPGGRLLLADTHPTGRVLPAVVKGMSRFAGHRTHDVAAVGRHADPLAAIDIRRYREALLEAGFRTVDFAEVKPSTGALLAVKDG